MLPHRGYPPSGGLGNMVRIPFQPASSCSAGVGLTGVAPLPPSQQQQSIIVPPPSVVVPISVNPAGNNCMGGTVRRSTCGDAAFTTVYVGRIAADVEDSLVQDMLEACGTVSNWKRTRDPTTRKWSSFGFAEFESPQGVERALNVLNDLPLGEKQLQVKAEQKVLDYMKEWCENDRREMFIKLRQELENSSGGGGESVPVNSVAIEVPEETEKAVDDLRKGGMEKVREEVQTLLDNALKKGMSGGKSGSRKYEPPTKGVSLRYEQHYREKLRETARRSALVQLDKDYTKKERDWERECGRRIRDMQRLEELRNRPVDLKRLIELDEQDAHENNWAKRKREEKRFARQAEKARDADDRQREEDELAVMQKETDSRVKREEEERHITKFALNIPSTADSTASDSNVHQDENNMNIIKSESGGSATSEIVGTSVSATTGTGVNLRTVRLSVLKQNRDSPHPEDSLSSSIVESCSSVETSTLKSIFGSDIDDGDAFTRKHKPLTKLESHYDKLNKQKQDKEKETRLTALREVVEKLPQERDAVFDTTIDWSTIEQWDVVEQQLKTWIKKKVVELMGADEDPVSQFVLQRVRDRCSPRQLLQEVVVFLDEEAESFVLKLWQMIIFEQLKLSHPFLREERSKGEQQDDRKTKKCISDNEDCVPPAKDNIDVAVVSN